MLLNEIKRQAQITDSVIVFFSGGKDSLVCLDLCIKHMKTVKVAYMYMVPELSWVEKNLLYYQKRYNTEILQLPHPATVDMLRTGSLSERHANMVKVSFNDAYNYARNYFDIGWIASGIRISDSIFRSSMIKNSGTIDHKRKIIYPVARWRKKDILEYIKRNRLILDRFSQIKGNSFGGFIKSELDVIVQHFPQDWQKIKEYFPYVEVMLRQEREEQQNDN
ncbi:MAG: phosphoadenosine phosphosulfate reductase family protein [Defluviitaleaceae bacterium]|nr:phosphoadenosine phosphosulfate reductase family protein [Defluviitaleaceae bacterium]